MIVIATILGYAEELWAFVFGGTIDTVTYTGKWASLGTALIENPIAALFLGILIVGLVFGLFGRGVRTVKG